MDNKELRSMAILKKILKVIDSISEYSSLLTRWLAWLLVLVGAYDTIARHFFNAPTLWAYDTMCMAGGALYVLGWSYVHLHESHIRVDLLFRLLSPKKKALLDIICALIFFFPLMGILTVVSANWAMRAWRINEKMISTFWYPPAAPYRTIFAIGIFLLTIQGIVKFIRDLYFLVRDEQFD